jgi:hypothetical protein
MKMTCTKFVRCERSTLKGFAEINFADLGMIIRDIAIHSRGNSNWAQPPAKPWLRDGDLAKGPDGKVLYVPIFEFTSKENRSRFSAAVIAAVAATPNGKRALKPEQQNVPDMNDEIMF